MEFGAGVGVLAGHDLRDERMGGFDVFRGDAHVPRKVFCILSQDRAEGGQAGDEDDEAPAKEEASATDG